MCFQEDSINPESTSHLKDTKSFNLKTTSFEECPLIFYLLEGSLLAAVYHNTKL